MKKLILALLFLSLAALLAQAQGPDPAAVAEPSPAEAGKALKVNGRAAVKSFQLLDRGTAVQPLQPDKGGTPPPTGPTVIAYPGGGPSAIAAGAPMAGAFPAPMLGGYFGNIFAPGVGFPSSFLTAGATSGFLVTGAYAWHSPFTAGGGAGGSSVRVLVAANAAVPPTPFAPVPTGAFVTAVPSAGAPGPAMVVGGPGILPTAVRVGGTAMAGPPTTPVPASAVFCGLVAGGPMFTPGWAGNGLGASLPPMGPGVPLRVGFFPPFFAPAGVLSAIPVPTPQDFIAGCFADSSTTPVELMAFGVE